MFSQDPNKTYKQMSQLLGVSLNY